MVAGFARDAWSTVGVDQAVVIVEGEVVIHNGTETGGHPPENVPF